MLSEESRAKLRAAGRKGGKAKVPKGVAVTGKAKEIGSKGGRKNAEKWRDT